MLIFVLSSAVAKMSEMVLWGFGFLFWEKGLSVYSEGSIAQAGLEITM